MVLQVLRPARRALDPPSGRHYSGGTRGRREAEVPAGKALTEQRGEPLSDRTHREPDGVGPETAGQGGPEGLPGSDRPRVEGSKLRHGAVFFVIGSLAILAGTLALTTGEETWHGVARFGVWMLVALFALAALRTIIEALSLLVLVNRTQDAARITLLEAVELTLEGYFIWQLIPASAAGVPYQAFLLTRKGVRAGWATAVVVVKGFIPPVFFFCVLLATLALALSGWTGPEASFTFVKVVGPLSALPTVFLIVILIFMVKFPTRFDRMVDRLAAAIARRLRGAAAQRVEETRVLIEEESHIFRGALTTMWGEKRLVLLAGTALIVLAFVAEFAVGLFILWGFGYRGSIIDPMLLQSLLKPILSASPTPGSVAVGEGGYIGFFAAYLPSHFIGIALVLWRLVLYFAPMFVGGLLVAKRIRISGRRILHPESA